MANLLDALTLPGDLKKLTQTELTQISAEIRDWLIDIFAQKGGHVGSNLGVIETTVALHTVFNSPNDKFIWDVSHQSLPHKILTGRLKLVKKFHEEGGASPFTNTRESEHDIFNVGHTSSSVSLAAGLAKGRDILAKSQPQSNSENIVAIIGDGSLSGGEAWEGLNIGGSLKSNFIVIFNDNEMSIDFNAGGIYSGLAKLRASNGRAQDNIFRFLGYDYRYIEDGNDVNKLVQVFSEIKDIDHPIVIHVHTKKGFGLPMASEHPELWHYHVPFNKQTGENISDELDKKRALIMNSTDTIINYIVDNEDAFAIVPGAPLGRTLQEKAPTRYLDMGIAEQTGIAFGSALAKRLRSSGKKPYMLIASTFVQRAYDQVIQDWTLNNTPAVLIVLGGGITPTDYTHQGMYDIPMLSNIPNLVYLSPTSEKEYLKMLKWAHKQDFPVAIRTSGGAIPAIEDRDTPEIEATIIGQEFNVPSHTCSGGVIPNVQFNVKSEIYQSGENIAILGLGHYFKTAEATASLIEKQIGVKPTIINPRFISHLDEDLLHSLALNHTTIVTLEDGSLQGGFGQKVATFFSEYHPNVRVLTRGGIREHVDHISYDTLFERYRLTPETIAADACNQNQ